MTGMRYEKITYNYQSEKTELLKALRNSRTLKIKAGWSREVGAGFIKEDIAEISKDGKNINITLLNNYTMEVETKDLNLRETEEAIKFLENE